MGILSEVVKKTLDFFFGLTENDWVKWVAQENEWQDDCDKFNNCYFIVKRMPKYPQHPCCRCYLVKIAKPIPGVTTKAICDIRKFTEYIFNKENNKGKMKLFESWGYSVKDSEYLQQLYVAQAEKKYSDGDYEYVGVNRFVAKILIRITVKDKCGRSQEVNTVWALKQYGQIELITPYSGHTYN